jgi:hypothetical protein
MAQVSYVSKERANDFVDAVEQYGRDHNYSPVEIYVILKKYVMFMEETYGFKMHSIDNANEILADGDDYVVVN